VLPRLCVPLRNSPCALHISVLPSGENTMGRELTRPGGAGFGSVRTLVQLVAANT